MQEYFEIHNKNNSEFKPRWIQENFRNIQNPFIDALYWLACDLTDISKDSKKWKAPNPDAGILRRLRNDLEHNWVRIAKYGHSTWLGKHDYAFVWLLSLFERRQNLFNQEIHNHIQYSDREYLPCQKPQ